MKRMMWVGAVLGGVVASGCVIRDVDVGDDGSGQAGGGGGAPVDTAWGCLDEEPTPLTNDIVNLQLEVVEATTRAPLSTATVRACSRLQTDCADPIGPPVKVDVSGKATVPMAQNFTGYLEVYGPKGPDVDDPDFVRTIVYLPSREIVRGASGRGIIGFSQKDLWALTALSGGSFDSETGFVVLTAINCQSQLAENVSYEILTANSTTDATKAYYTVNRVPNTSATKTDLSGTGGFTSLLPDLASFGATIDLDGVKRDITPEAGTSALVRPGWYTQVYVAP